MSDKHLTVIAPPGLICPKQGGIRYGTITSAAPETVPDTAFYRRLLREGSLLAYAPCPESPDGQKKGEK
jgi:hypothetical protein